MNHFLTLLQSRGITAPPKTDVRVVGIDLGTTNSTVSEILWKKGHSAPESVRTLDVDQETASGRHTGTLVPSIVCAQKNGPLVGEGAKVLRGRMADQSFGLKQGRDIFWECKNHMGLTRTYHQAPAGYRSAKEIGAHVLRFLLDSAQKDSTTPIDRTIVTVPASFRIPQRQDTQKAAELADIAIAPGDLVDEPVAAFLDYIFSHDTSKLELTGAPKNVLLFDFGGGTCDVAIFKVAIAKATGQISMAPLTVSRYHRLGGGDIDDAIVHQILIPQLVAQNNLQPFDLSYEDKTHCITPALLSIAESLKIGLCKEITRLTTLGVYPNGDDRRTVFKRNPGATTCVLKDGRTLALNSPVLNAVEFDELLTPFLDQDILVACETEYLTTCSIFAPLTDAMNRAGLSAEDIAVCLMAGGSSFIPKVQQELDQFFSAGFVLTFDTPEAAKLAISRGAAYHSLMVHLTGAGIVQPITADAVLLQTNNGPVEMIPASTPLPYPGTDQWGSVEDLKVPDFPPDQPRNLKLELVTSDEMRLFTGVWEVPKNVRTGTQLLFQYQIDANQIMRLRLNLATAPEEVSWEREVENPLVNIEYPDSRREHIEKTEEELRVGTLTRSEKIEKMTEVASLWSELGQHEKALNFYKVALQAKGAHDPALLNKMGILCGEMRDHEREAKFFEASASAAQWSAPLFNLALSQKRRGLLKEAKASIDEAIVRNASAPNLTLRAVIADALQDPMKREECLKAAMKLFGSVTTMTDWELGWYLTAADLMDNEAQAKKARDEQQKRRRDHEIPDVEGLLPDRGAK
ncbi:MAG: Hsp70 family protein [bacterium]